MTAVDCELTHHRNNLGLMHEFSGEIRRIIPQQPQNLSHTTLLLQSRRP